MNTPKKSLAGKMYTLYMDRYMLFCVHLRPALHERSLSPAAFEGNKTVHVLRSGNFPIRAGKRLGVCTGHT